MDEKMMLLRKDGSGVIAIPQPRHAWLAGQMGAPTPQIGLVLLRPAGRLLLRR
jgi:hypothetical protein